MTAKRRYLGQYSHYDGSVVDPKTLATVPVLPDGQIAVVTDQPGQQLYVRQSGTLVPSTDISGLVAKAGDTMTGPLGLPAGTTDAAPLATPHGVAPTSPNNGDIWTTDAGMFVQVDGATVGPLIESETELETTQEPLQLIVDFATGDSPPAGYRIRTQADFDALGAPLKYVQEVLEVMPPYLNWPVWVRVLAGPQYAKDLTASAFGVTAFWSTERNYLRTGRGASSVAPGDRPAGFGFIWAGIEYQGTSVVEEASIEGVITNTAQGAVFTRTAGSWTPEELHHKFVLITSGAMAGVKLSIVDNDATTLTIPFNPFATGAATINIESNATQLISTLADGTPVQLFIYEYRSLPGNDGLIYWFSGFDINPDPTPSTFSYLVKISLRQCNIRAPFIRYDGPSDGVSYVILSMNYIRLTSSGVYLAFNPFLLISGNIIRGSVRLMDLRDSSFVFAGDNHYFVEGSYNSLVFYMERGSSWVSTGRQFIHGNGLCTGLYIAAGNPAMVRPAFIIDDCSIAIRIVGGHTQFPTSLSGTGNTTVWNLSNRATVEFLSTSPLTGSWINIDGQQFALSDLGPRGSSMHGRYGSLLGSF